MTIAEGLTLAYFAINVVCALRVIYSPRASSAALGWIVLLFLIPFVGTAAYLLIGEPRLGNKRAKRTQEMQRFYDAYQRRFVGEKTPSNSAIAPRFNQLVQLAEHRSGIGLDSGNDVELLHRADDMLISMRKDIEAAQYSCLLMFYIIDGQGRVNPVLEALMKAAERGVNCQLLVDDVGSSAFLKSAWPARLRASGVELTNSLPVGLLKTLFVRSDLRNHRKLLIVDYEIAYTGSFNLVDPALFKQEAGVGEWRDAMLRCRGPVVLTLAGIFYGDWAVENEHNLQETLQRLSYYKGIIGDYLPPSVGEALLQVIPFAPDRETSVMYDTLVNALYHARERIIISTPYFVPDELLFTALQHAAWRGVNVTLIMPHRVDSWLVRKASRTYYKPLLKAGVNIAHHQDGLLHTKAVLVDDVYALFGTMNMDMRSFFLNMELSLAVYDKKTVAAIDGLLHSYLAQSCAVNLQQWEKRPRLQYFIERVVRLASPLL
ncbi:cardiolipin synthase [Suttonella sp. R2A3]|uniref:cardiolipin synthase n=1 Tax=Suttonella sp. R2A3 TaxID=2908648 RepID=UPI001F408A69|nr:cardiolipin synthase [Suttonella sp. R2A3]UJF24534.1 cardiolipin synthase [Suttonella sp. R2A3]